VRLCSSKALRGWAYALPLAVFVLYAATGCNARAPPRVRGVPASPASLRRWVIVLALIEALVLTTVITEAIKLYVGWPRPVFFAKCDYKGYRTAVLTGNYSEYFQLTTGEVMRFVTPAPRQ
jgi:hypothetical protein